MNLTEYLQGNECIKGVHEITSEWHFDRTDKNGTDLYYSYCCPKCGGDGYIEYYSYIDRGVCYMCGGTGADGKTHHLKAYLPEYWTKIQAKRHTQWTKQVEGAF